MALTNLTDEQIRKIRDYIPELSNRPPGFDLGNFLSDLIDSLNEDRDQLVSGTATVTGVSANTGAIAVGTAYDGSPVVATLTDAKGSADFVTTAEWDGSGNLTITLNTAPGGVDVATVSYIVDAR
jgi:hypothetical protein